MDIELRIGLSVGVTMSIHLPDGGGYDFLKPTVFAEMKFSETPSAKDVQDHWEYLWNEQVGPQLEHLLDLALEESSKRGIVRDPVADRETRVVIPERPEPPEGAYT